MTNAKALVLDSLCEVEELLEYDRESIDVEASEKHRDFCLQLLEAMMEDEGV